MNRAPVPSGDGRIGRLIDELRRSLWLWPTAAVMLAVASAEILVRVERNLAGDGAFGRAAFGGDADAARTVLSTIAGASMTVLGVTISLTLAVLTLTAQGYSPRVLSRFMADRGVQAVVSVLIGSFTFSLATLRLVLEDQVPGLSVNLAVLIALASLAVLVGFFHHLASEIRVERVIARAWDDARAPVEALPAAGGTPPPPDSLGETVATVRATRTGRVVWIDQAALVRVARGVDGAIDIPPQVGAFVCEGEPVALVHGVTAPDERAAATIISAVHLGTQRTSAGDPSFGLRQLTDIALRALSPGVNDSTTAHEAILRCADLLRRLADRDLGICVREDAAADESPGAVRLVRRRPNWEDLVGLCIDQCAADAEAQADAATMLVLLDALARVAAATDDPARLEVLRSRARRLGESARRGITDPTDITRVEEASAALA